MDERIEQLEKVQRRYFFVVKTRPINLVYMGKAVSNKGALKEVEAPIFEEDREYSKLFIELSNENECVAIMWKKVSALSLLGEKTIFNYRPCQDWGYLMGYLASGHHSR